MLVGYMRVSADGDRQVLDLQRDALLAAGVDQRHLFDDHAQLEVMFENEYFHWVTNRALRRLV